jgi:hypothetical protein
VPTFHNIGLYWKASSGMSGIDALVRYRAVGAADWSQAMPMWFDGRNQDYADAGVADRNREYRGSIVRLKPYTSYEVQAMVPSSGETASVTVRTWNENFPVGTTRVLPATSGSTLAITAGGSPSGYALYTAAPGGSVIDVARRSSFCVDVRASYVIIRGLTLKRAKIHGIHLDDGVHDVIIEGCDISDWGRIASDGWGVDMDSGIASTVYAGAQNVKRVIIQRNKIHHPHGNANNWTQPRPYYDNDPHPYGPQAISFEETPGNHVIRYNEIYSDSTHYFNDAIGGAQNYSLQGFSSYDTDIYGNKVSHSWDDSLELEGASANMRVYENYIDRVYNHFATSTVSVGPLYVFNNVTYRTQYSDHHGLDSGRMFKAQSKDVNGTYWGGGRVYVLHNTQYSTDDNGADEGISNVGDTVDNYVVRNNILPVREPFGRCIRTTYDYDLFIDPAGSLPSGQEPHGIESQPEWDTASAVPYTLKAGTPGQGDGVPLPNFNDGFIGSGPDRGAQERGGRPLRFGVAAGSP